MDEDFKATLGRLIQAAQINDTTDEIRSDLLDAYNAEPYGDEVKGSSSFVTSDVRDAVEALLPDLMELFTNAENLVEFVPKGPEDEEAAKQESEVCSHIFWQENSGFLLLYTAFKEALIQQNAYLKSGWQEKSRIEIEEYEGLTQDEANQIWADITQDRGEPELLESAQREEMMPQGPVPVFDIKLRIVSNEKRYVIEAVAQDDIYITPRWHSLQLDGVPCVGHRKEMEKGDLRAMGFSEESLDAATSDASEWEDSETARFDTEFHFSGDDDDEGDDSTRKVTVFESYVRADIDGDGRAELLQVWSINDGSEILEWEDGTPAIKEVSRQPFSALTPHIFPHRHVGQSTAEFVADIQKVKTVLTRHMLDNLYRNNHARPQYDENMAGPNLATDLANTGPGYPIRTGGALIQWDRPPPVIDALLPVLASFEDQKEQRTGAARVAQGLNAESLNQHSEMTVDKILDGATKKRLLIARTFAETGLADLFRRMHADLRSGPVRQMVMRLRNQWVAVNPRTWRHRTDMTVSIGMGSGDRDKRRQGLMLMGQMQEKLMAAGAPIVGLPHIYATAEKIMETFGFDNIQPFMMDPAEIPPPDPNAPKEPDPQQIMIEAQIEDMRARAQAEQVKAQTAQIELQMKQQQQQAELQAEAQKAEREYMLRMEDIRQRQAAAAGKLALDQQKAVMEDDRIRDVEELKAATGFQRDIAKSAQISPPISYDRVTNGR